MNQEIFIHRDFIAIHNFPVPPSYNECLMPSGGRLIKTGVSRFYEGNAAIWKAKNKDSANIISEIMKEWIKESMISVSVIIAWPYDSVFTKSKDAMHKIKSLDVTNRIKPLHDRLVDCFGVDDMYFFTDYSEKCYLERDSKLKNPTMVITFARTKPQPFNNYLKTLSQVKESLSARN